MAYIILQYIYVYYRAVGASWILELWRGGNLSLVLWEGKGYILYNTEINYK